MASLGIIATPKTLRRDGAVMPDTSREVVVEGVRYRSMAAAGRALSCSYSKIYRLIGEEWRYEKRKPSA